MRHLILAVALAVAAPVAAQRDVSPASPDRWAAVDAALGRPGATQSDGVRRYGFPRSDLSVRLDGVEVRPALALGSWLAFQPMGDRVMVMGDLVLTHEEVNPVLTRLLAGGLTVTALHNHLLRSTPATMYMHVGGHGEPRAIAATLRAALAETKTPTVPQSAGAEAMVDLDTAALDTIMGRAGKANGGVWQYLFPRAERLSHGGAAVSESMGTGTVLNFQTTGGGKAAITGDFVLTASEVDPVLRALRDNGIEVTALHNHMLDDEPRLFFMHFWANDDAARLARGLRSALDRTNVKRR